MYELHFFNSIKESVNEDSIDKDLKERFEIVDKILFKNANLSWREKEKPNFLNLNKTKEIGLELKGYLNKLSNKNYDKLLIKITNYIDTHKNFDFFIETLFSNCVVQPLYCGIYVKLLRSLESYSEIIKTHIENKIVNYMSTLEESQIKESDGLSYDEFCKNNVVKLINGGYTQFIGELFNNDLASYKLILGNINYFVDLIKQSDDFLEGSILCLDKLLRTVKYKMNIHDEKNLKRTLQTIVDTKKFPQLRHKFKIMNLLEVL